jgi:hypothetical protein
MLPCFEKMGIPAGVETTLKRKKSGMCAATPWWSWVHLGPLEQLRVTGAAPAARGLQQDVWQD